MAPARAARPGLGFTARASVTPPRFRRKKRRERWQRLRFEFQRRRRSPNETWVGGGGDLGSRAGRDPGREGGRETSGDAARYQRRHLLCVHDGLDVGRGRHPPRDTQRLQVRPGLRGFAVTRTGFPLMGVCCIRDLGFALWVFEGSERGQYVGWVSCGGGKSLWGPAH